MHRAKILCFSAQSTCRENRTSAQSNNRASRRDSPAKTKRPASSIRLPPGPGMKALIIPAITRPTPSSNRQRRLGCRRDMWARCS